MLNPTQASPLVLLVEDDDGDAEIARLALERSAIPHDLARARDGVEAVDIALARGRDKEPGRRAALILLDLRLPRRSGKEVLRMLRDHPETQHTPIVMMSGSNQPADLAECYSLRANSYFRKPMDLETFIENVGLLLFYWLELNAPCGVESAARNARRLGSEGVQGAARSAVDFATRRRLRVPAVRAAGLVDLPSPILVLDRDAETSGRTAEGIAAVTGESPLVARSMEDAAQKLSASSYCKGRLLWTCLRMVVMDIDHHPVDGPAMLDQIRARVDHRLPVVFFTANDDPSFIDDCSRHGPNSIVRKPGSLDDYTDTVKLITHYWLRLNETVPYGVVP
ncbi:MAG: response regulator [Pseudomonadota bacterium]|nr:response regulator [Pseudomonadota bacterium]